MENLDADAPVELAPMYEYKALENVEYEKEQNGIAIEFKELQVQNEMERMKLRKRIWKLNYI